MDIGAANDKELSVTYAEIKMHGCCAEKQTD